ncbi:SseB family protein [Salinispora arenicola]|uniref:SseB family protein n=1 Tax=Salinispora arenicola TaxID=168697 RepID=UPI00037428F2|nr:SseB family protein [Salinispora arenicola]
MTEWEPATEAETALRDALRANDQQRYFRILARTDLLLPVSAQALAGQTPMNWGTWTTSGRTHVLAFTSVAALRACLGEHAGANRRVAYGELADHWPNHEWWLAVNPGLPIEGYLPAWYVAQLSRGDVRLPGRPMGTRARLERTETYTQPRSFGASSRPEVEPAVGPPGQGRVPRAGQTPEDTAPLRPTSSAPPPGTPLRTPADLRAAALRRPLMDTGRTAATGGEPAALWPRPGHPPADGGAPADRPPPEETERPIRRSFFEPATVRPNRDERGVPPSRLARGSQQFPRRRLADDAPPAAAPMFSAGAATRAGQDGSVAPPGGGTAPPVSPQQATAEEARTVRFPVPDSATLRLYAHRDSEEEAASRPRPSPVGSEPAPNTEPASGPPLPRRSPPPTVIEGTIIESRNLTAGSDAVSATTPIPATAGAVPGPIAAGAAPPDTAAPPGAEPGALLPAQPSVAETAAEPGGSDSAHATERVDSATAEDVPRPGPPPAPTLSDFAPANAVEEELVTAATSGNPDTLLSTLLLAQVLLPIAADSAPGSRPGEEGFVWRTEDLDGGLSVVVYTSPERLADHTAGGIETIRVRFVQLIRRWPDRSWSFVVNPGTPIGTKLPGEQIVGLATWAAEVGLGDDRPEPEPVLAGKAVPSDPPAPTARPRYRPPGPESTSPVVMQKAVAASQLAYYLERGYDRVSGFVHRAGELAHLTTPAQLYDALGLGYPGSPFDRGAERIYVLRWPAFRPSLYRIPYGGQTEAAMRAMEGWVIERPPFRGNGFAPGESSDVVAEFKVDSARLPHGAQLWRIGADGTERMVATLDADETVWRQVGDG